MEKLLCFVFLSLGQRAGGGRGVSRSLNVIAALLLTRSVVTRK